MIDDGADDAQEWARLIAEAEQRELLAEFERAKAGPQASQCRVCDSPYRELIDEMIRRGGGGSSISDFLRRRLDASIGETTIRRHKRAHTDA